MNYEISFLQQNAYVFENNDDALFFAYYCDEYFITRIQNYSVVIDLTIKNIISSVILNGTDKIIDKCVVYDNVVITPNKIIKLKENLTYTEQLRRVLKINCIYIEKENSTNYSIQIPEFELRSD